LRAATFKYPHGGFGDGFAKRRQRWRLKNRPILKWPARQLFKQPGKTVWVFSSVADYFLEDQSFP
jgi:hypothetical protein